MYTVSLGHLTGPMEKFASGKLANMSLPRGGQKQWCRIEYQMAIAQVKILRTAIAGQKVGMWS